MEYTYYDLQEQFRTYFELQGTVSPHNPQCNLGKLRPRTASRSFDRDVVNAIERALKSLDHPDRRYFVITTVWRKDYRRYTESEAITQIHKELQQLGMPYPIENLRKRFGKNGLAKYQEDFVNHVIKNLTRRD